ncbi:hypothetical protein BD309DRAFT_990453 [Dichomitus squalens]|uniref:Uncharacterized protein n=1 Tax=Dichomitus squalens TaxID=114155 RepID=A0A4Q9NTN7_9APHY|nr:hypothetical protein BD311DRAFT_777062 [Dichomitus squalens]TBU44205.1 hypothetical protein BD309DRAFT_990453 [Dichomitus squalens]TBU61495.1 hypothetical protein BD310DRAFT_946597 [Dichomitus squalens]
MSYDLFSLNFVPRQEDRTIIDLVDPKGLSYYTKRRVLTTEYKIEVYDTLSESLLASVSAPSASSKHKTLQLHNPDSVVELKSTGVLTFKWSFKWEDHEFEWKREECYILRKPDPAVLVAQTKEPPGKLQTRNVQILDYNINRFDINDRKGLEIVILTALLTFSDLNEAAHSGSLPTPTPVPASTPAAAAAPPVLSPTATSPSTSIAAPNVLAAIGTAPRLTSTAAPDGNAEAPAVPPRPAPRTGVERVAEMHALRNALGEGDVNEVSVWEECDVNDYAQYAEQLLNDEAMLFISIRSASQLQVPKVLKVVEETKRLRYKAGIAEEEELHQYVIYETEKRKGPRRINLNDPDPKKGKIPDADKYAPPTSLTIHLSKIDMPELQPKPNPATQRRASESNTTIVRAPSPQFAPPPSHPAVRPPSPPPPFMPPSYPVYHPPSPPAAPTPLAASSLPNLRSPSPPKPPAPSHPGVLPPMPVAIRELTDKERKKAEKERQRLEKEREKAAKEREKFEKKKGRRQSSAYTHVPPPPPTNMFTRPYPSPSPSPQPHPYHTPAHMVHPYQPSPSPSQLNNPGIYGAPPPHAPSPRPRPVSMAYNSSSSGVNSPSAYQPSYLSPMGSGGSRPQSVYGSRDKDGKGPVSGLLHMWSKD